MTTLRLVYSKSVRNSSSPSSQTSTRPRSRSCDPLQKPAVPSLVRKAARLVREHPSGAAMIEDIVTELLADASASGSAMSRR